MRGDFTFVFGSFPQARFPEAKKGLEVLRQQKEQPSP
ncbi:hypothetical protein CHELA41_22903 [Hyphomicrobiales bacterium]|nr:hypothetical protein CHELA41_22903 [Hyphomicrobiales bacterium]